MSSLDELKDILRQNAEDEINKTEWDGVAAQVWTMALSLVEAYGPKIEHEAFYRGAKRVAAMERP